MNIKNIFKKIFRKSSIKTNNNSVEQNQSIKLMLEIAMSDGILEEVEIAFIKKRLSHNIKSDAQMKELIDEVKNSTSIYNPISNINKKYSNDEKLELLKSLWELINVDNSVDSYEENLYFKIAELIYVKRSIANRIKQKKF